MLEIDNKSQKNVEKMNQNWPILREKLLKIHWKLMKITKNLVERKWVKMYLKFWKKNRENDQKFEKNMWIVQKIGQKSENMVKTKLQHAKHRWKFLKIG